MITGIVRNMQACVNVIFRLPNQPDLQIECIVDTGFEGALTLPISAIRALNLSRYGRLNANLANNASVATDVYVGHVVWDAKELPVAVLAMGRSPLIGTALLKGYRLTVDFKEGGRVSIEQAL